MKNQIKLIENKTLDSTLEDSDIKIIESRVFSDDPLSENFCLGLSVNSDNNLQASYYVGVSWLKENHLSVLVNPKRGYDYLKIFCEVLKIESDKESDYLSESYRIFFDKPEIKVNETINISSPLIMLHFLTLVKRIVKKGAQYK